MMDNAALTEWLKTRPAIVQRLAKEFPLLSRVQVPPHREYWYVVGWIEQPSECGDTLIISPIDPSVDYDKSMAARAHVCAEHYR
jgi:hypothetical protein